MPTLGNSNCTNPDCYNRSFVVIDTIFLDYLIRSIVKGIDPSLEVIQRYSTLKEEISFFFDKICLCSIDGKIHVSEAVFEQEIYPNDGSGSVLSALNDFFPDQEHSEMLSIFRSKFEITAVDNNDIDAIKSATGTSGAWGPGDCDISLIVLALYKSTNGGKSIIITEDDKLRCLVEEVYALGNFNLASSQVRTRDIFRANHFNFLNNIHDCCNISSDQFIKVFHHLYDKGKGWISGKSGKDMPDKPKRFKEREMDRAFKNVFASVMKKAENISNV